MSVLLALLFLLSGAAGLFYEAVWSRYLSLFVGHDAYAQVLTLVIFLGGMGLGALLVSRRSARIRDPLFVYALVEAVIGVFGLAFHDLLYLPITGWAYAHLFPALGGGLAVTLSKWLLAGLLILPQSILLGATFPLMSAGVLRRLPAQPGRTLSLLYFSNSLGAAVGVLVAGFVLYAMAGLPGTLAAAAMLNLLVAMGALAIARFRAPAPVPPVSGTGEPPVAAAAAPATLGRLLLVMAFGTAIASFVYEIGWLRMLSLVLGSSTHSFELMLSAFILGLALGSWWIRRRADRLADPLRTLAIVQLAMGACALLSLPLYLQSFGWTAGLMQATARSESGYVLYTLARYLICLVVMLPATFCAGMTLPLMTRMLLPGSGERAIGAIYSANTLGSIVGAAATGLLLLPWLGLRGALVAGGALDMLLGLLALRAMASAGRPAPRLAALGAGTLALLTALVLWGIPWTQGLLSSGVFRVGRLVGEAQREVLFHADGRTATVHVTRFRNNGIRVLATNGKPDGSLTTTWLEPCDTTAPAKPFSSDDGTQAMLSLLLLAHAPAARTGAVIGHGTGMSSHILLGSPRLERLTTIEIEPAMVAGSRVFYPINRRVFDDPRSRIVIDDAKAYFAAANTRFDLILSEPSNPWVSGVSGLFTTEFYHRVRGYLTEGGVLGQWLHTYELSDGLVLSVLAALHANFADYRVFLINGGDLLVVASPDRPLPKADWSVTRLPMIRGDLCRFLPMSDAALERTVVLDRAGLAPLLERGMQPNSDFYPVLDLGAESARFLQQSAVGVATLGNGLVDYLADPALRAQDFDTATTSALLPAPRVKAMLLAAQVRQAAPDTGWTDVPGAAERYLQRVWARQTAGDGTGVNWRGWTTDFWSVRRSLQGGGAPLDTAFFGKARAFATRAGAPWAVRATIAFGEAFARHDLAGAAVPAELLLQEARTGRFWIPPDELLDGAVRALLAAGRRDDARAAYDLVRPNSSRVAGDLRLLLLNSYIEAARASAH
ncbi:MAG TPA: fused MFS/spermidine synthase [Gemmatimonadales bacterium]|nr:fused MFS/spermidine synthase [Gemmatimonadales bacterium]